jgi:hypothetical protein
MLGSGIKGVIDKTCSEATLTWKVGAILIDLISKPQANNRHF